MKKFWTHFWLGMSLMTRYDYKFFFYIDFTFKLSMFIFSIQGLSSC